VTSNDLAIDEMPARSKAFVITFTPSFPAVIGRG